MALYYSTGTISEMSEVQSGTSKSGREWQKMTLTLDIPGYQGAITKQIFQVFGDDVVDVMKFQEGDKVKVGFSLYAREWNDRWYTNVDLVSIKADGEAAEPVAAQEIDFSEGDLNPDRHEDLPF